MVPCTHQVLAGMCVCVCVCVCVSVCVCARAHVHLRREREREREREMVVKRKLINNGDNPTQCSYISASLLDVGKQFMVVMAVAQLPWIAATGLCS